MVRSLTLLSSLVWLALAAAPARAAEFFTEDLRIPMAEAGPQGLEAFLVRPAGAKRYPLALLSHGSPRSFDDRATMSAHNYYGIALEYARRGVTVNAVCPGYTDTPLVADATANIVAKTGRSEQEARAALAKVNPMQRLVTPEEVADAILWLASEGASSINGQAVAVAGGEVFTG